MLRCSSLRWSYCRCMRTDIAPDQEHEPSNGHNGQARRSTFGKGLTTIGAWTVGLVVAYLLWTFSLPATNADGTCEGIGFGCSLNPRDGALFIGVLIGVPVLTATVVVATFVLALLSRTEMRSGVWAGTLAMFGGLVVTVAVGAALSLL